MNADIHAEQEKQTVRQNYSTPILMEYGNLNKLTHGDLTTNVDAGGPAYALPG